MIITTSEQMHELGRQLAEYLRGGDLILLHGGLGAGKTTLTQGIGEGLGVRGHVSSPTFIIARLHRGDGGPDLVHVDAYRLGSLDELDALDLDISLEEAVTVVEWGEGLAEILSDDRLEISIIRSSTQLDDDEDPREVLISAIGDRWDGVELPASVPEDSP